MRDDENTPEYPWRMPEGPSITGPFTLRVRRIAPTPQPRASLGDLLGPSRASDEEFESLDGSPLTTRCPVCDETLFERDTRPALTWMSHVVLGMWTPTSLVTLECRGCARDNDLLEASAAWPAVLELRRRRMAGETSSEEFIDLVCDVVSARIDRSALHAEVHAALAELARDHGDGTSVIRRRLLSDPAAAALAAEARSITVSIPWTEVLTGFDPATGDSSGRWQSTVEDFIAAIGSTRLGPNGRAAQWLSDPRPRLRWIRALRDATRAARAEAPDDNSTDA